MWPSDSNLAGPPAGAGVGDLTIADKQRPGHAGCSMSESAVAAGRSLPMVLRHSPPGAGPRAATVGHDCQLYRSNLKAGRDTGKPGVCDAGAKFNGGTDSCRLVTRRPAELRAAIQGRPGPPIGSNDRSSGRRPRRTQ